MAQYSTPLDKFEHQRQRAKVRGIEWLLTFEEWWAIWQQSGKWPQRGRKGDQYVMARRGDVGPYSTTNVLICLQRQNSRDAHANGRIPARRRIPRAFAGRPVVGWTFRAGHKNPYQVKFRDKYVGCYRTQQEAEAVYSRLLAAD